MKIVFTGGGTGGHFYPLIAVSEEVSKYAHDNKLIIPKKYYFGPSKYDEKELYKASMKYVYCPSGKIRRTKDILSRIKNFFSFIGIFLGIIKATVNMYIIFPDVVFSKGGYASFPVLFAARILRIPVIIHESDATMGRVTKWSSSFAKRIAISYIDTEKELSEKQKKLSALIGVPIRRQLLKNKLPDAHKILRLDKNKKTLVILGGSTGAQYINDIVLDSLPLLLEKYQVIHQTGTKNFASVKKETTSLLKLFENKNVYHPIAFFDTYNLRALYSVADCIITRAGSTALFEIAEWGIPSIVIPIPEEISHDQRKNAYAYSRYAGGIVIEQENLSPNLLISEIDKIILNENNHKNLSTKAKNFSTPEAAKKLANILVQILKSHE